MKEVNIIDWQEVSRKRKLIGKVIPIGLYLVMDNFGRKELVSQKNIANTCPELQRENPVDLCKLSGHVCMRELGQECDIYDEFIRLLSLDIQ